MRQKCRNRHVAKDMAGGSAKNHLSESRMTVFCHHQHVDVAIGGPVQQLVADTVGIRG